MGSECVESAGSPASGGYRRVMHNGKQVLAHRVAAQEAGLDIVGKVVMHSCDNPACVNPKHLRVGTQRDNMQDMAAKGRHRGQKATSCKHGHEFTENNTAHDKHGWRYCRECARNHSTKVYYTHTRKPNVREGRKGVGGRPRKYTEVCA